MAEENQTDVSGDVVENPAGTPSFSANIPNPDPFKSAVLDPPKAPEGVPEKFWDAEKGEVRLTDFVKSYAELEKKLGQPKEQAEGESEEGSEEGSEEQAEEQTEESEEGSEEGSEEQSEEGGVADLTEAVEAARTVYAEKGELPAEAREPFLKAGISNEQIDLYLQGVKAHEAGLKSAAMKAAGVEDYAEIEAAIAWAGENWTEKQKIAFNAQAGDLETVSGAVKVLFDAYRGANPGEGRLTNVNSGANRGDVFNSRVEFDQALAAADKARDPVARKAAIDKLTRSLKAKSMK